MGKQSDKTFSTDGQNKGPQTDARTWATKTTGQVRVTTARYFCFMKDPVKGWGKTTRGGGRYLKTTELIEYSAQNVS